MKKTWTEKDVENLIRDSAFPNPAHKDALRRQLLESDVPLDLEDLEMAAGGRALPGQEEWEGWPGSGKEES